MIYFAGMLIMFAGLMFLSLVEDFDGAIFSAAVVSLLVGLFLFNL
jgi:hypothetical protein